MPLPSAPQDTECDDAWVEIMAVARRHCLIVQAGGGVATLALPGPQREQGVRELVLRMECKSEPVEPVTVPSADDIAAALS